MQTMVSFGDAIKADDNGRVRGYLVRFGGADLEGDYFTASTDFGRPMKSGERVPMNLYYHHGQDKQVGKSRIGTGYITMDDKGLWYESQVEMADQYQKMIQELAKSGKLGYSSGATGHMVERKKMSDGRYEITRWPIGEASLTPTPAEPMNMVKSLKDMYGDMEGYAMEEQEMMIPVAPGEDVATFVQNVYGDLDKEMVHEGLEALYERLCAGVTAAYDSGLGSGHVDAIIDAFAMIDGSSEVTHPRALARFRANGSGSSTRIEVGENKFDRSAPATSAEPILPKPTTARESDILKQ